MTTAGLHGSSSAVIPALPELGLAEPEAVLATSVKAVRTAAAAMKGDGERVGGTGYASGARDSDEDLSGAAAADSTARQRPTGLYAVWRSHYDVDGEALDLSDEEMAQLAAAFRCGDVEAIGRIPTDRDVLLACLLSLDIHPTEENARDLMITLKRAELNAAVEDAFSSEAAGGGDVDVTSWTADGITAITFPTFAACLAKLRGDPDEEVAEGY